MQYFYGDLLDLLRWLRHFNWLLRLGLNRLRLDRIKR